MKQFLSFFPPTKKIPSTSKYVGFLRQISQYKIPPATIVSMIENKSIPQKLESFILSDNEEICAQISFFLEAIPFSKGVNKIRGHYLSGKITTFANGLQDSVTFEESMQFDKTSAGTAIKYAALSDGKDLLRITLHAREIGYCAHRDKGPRPRRFYSDWIDCIDPYEQQFGLEVKLTAFRRIICILGFLKGVNAVESSGEKSLMWQGENYNARLPALDIVLNYYTRKHKIRITPELKSMIKAEVVGLEQLPPNERRIFGAN